jgi:hypothetical protein
MLQKKKIESGVEIKLVGTTPLSFNLKPGAVLTVKTYEPSSSNRPTVGGKFKSSAFLVFNGITKVGRISPAALKKLNNKPSPTCTVASVNEEKNSLVVYFDL